MNEFDLIVRFKSDEDSITLQNYIIDHLFEDKLFDNLQMWDFRRSEVLSILNLRKENAELKELIEVKKLEKLELKAQIEKMKNFYNCAHSNRALCPNEHNCKGCKDWELPE